MPDLVGIKVKAFKNMDGSMNYPNFRGNLQIFRDKPDYKSGAIMYDKTSDCETDSPHSPIGETWCVKLVDREFAEQALAAFPERVFEMTEAEIEDFWDNRINVSRSENRINNEILQGLHSELLLRKELNQNLEVTKLKAKIAKALDPDDETEPGIKRDKKRRWADAKESGKIRIISTTP